MVTKDTYLNDFDVINKIQNNGIFILNTSKTEEEVNEFITENIKKTLCEKNIKLYIINAYDLAQKSGLRNKISTIMESSILKLLNILDYQKLEEKINVKNIIKIIILSILMFLFRNNGIHVFILTFPFLILINKNNRKRFLIIFLVVVSLFVTYSKVLLPYFKITPSSVRETLSIPFQQTARYVKEHENEVTNNEKKVIDKILGYTTLKDRYKEEISDPVKNGFNKYSTKEDLKNYFVVWFEMLKKHPLTYVEATINNTYGYFYPFSTKWYIYYKYTPIIKEHGIDYHYNNLTNLRTNLSNYGNIFPYIPIIGLIVNIGFSNYLLIFMLFYLIYKKKYKEMCYLFPSFVLTLVCIASPVNTYFRYALPTIFAMPVMISMFFKMIRNGK